MCCVECDESVGRSSPPTSPVARVLQPVDEDSSPSVCLSGELSPPPLPRVSPPRLSVIPVVPASPCSVVTPWSPRSPSRSASRVPLRTARSVLPPPLSSVLGSVSSTERVSHPSLPRLLLRELSCPPALRYVPVLEDSTSGRVLAPPHSSTTSPSAVCRLSLSFCSRLDVWLRSPDLLPLSEVEVQEFFSDWLPPPPRAALTVQQRFPAFNQCSTLASMVEVAVSLLSASDVEEAARYGAAMLSSDEEGIDARQIQRDTRGIVDRGLFPYLAALQRARSHLMVGPSALSLVSPAHPYFSRLEDVAYGRNHWLFPADYVPNCGKKFHIYPASIAPHDAIAAHFARLQRSGRYIILRESFWLAYAARAAIPFAYVHCFLAPKPGAPLMRLVANPSALISPAKKQQLIHRWGRITPTQFIDLCYLLHSAYSAFPDHPIFLARRDVDSAYQRIAPPLSDLLHLIFPFFHRGVRSVAIPLVSTFGNSDSNFQFNVISEVLLSLSRARTHAWVPAPHNFSFSAMATDDLIVAGPRSLVETELEATAHDIPTAVGEGGVSADKDRLGQQLEVIGFFVDTAAGLLSVSQKGFISLLEIFFGSPIPCVGDRIPTPRLQRVASLALRYSPFLTVLLPFSRGFSASTSPLLDWSVLSPRAVSDWVMWRMVLRLAVDNPSWFDICYTVPLLFASPSMETEEELAHRQAAAADTSIFVDACMSSAGAGVYCPDSFTLFFDMLGWQYFPDKDGHLCRVHICLFEFIASVVGAIMWILLRLPSLSPTSSHRPFHLHVWTDNSSAYWTIRRSRSAHPISIMLLQALALVQLRFGVLITIGHVPGVRNEYADALSRSFLVPRASELHRVLALLPHYHLGPYLTPFLVRACLLLSRHPLQAPRVAHTLLEYLIGIPSVLSSESLPMPREMSPLMC